MGGEDGVGDGALGDQGAGAKEVPGGVDVITGFVPEVGKTQKFVMGDVSATKDSG